MPKEIEVYYYKKGEFEDESVHQNELQTQKHKNHFYVHRKGTKQTDSYKGGNRTCLDFVVSDDTNTYYSFLIRSAIVGKEHVVGPNKVLKKIKEVCNLDNDGLERMLVNVVSNNTDCDVLFSNRINLTKGFVDYKLRAVLCDENFKDSKYLYKEKLVLDYISRHDLLQNQAEKYAKEKLGYVPSSIKQS